MMGDILLAIFLLAACSQAINAINMTGCIYNEPWPLVFDATKQPTGYIKSVGYDEGGYPPHAYCDYTIKASKGQIIKLTFKEFDIHPASRCSNDKVYLMDGPNQDAPDLGSYCGTEPPDYPIVSTGNAMHLSLRTNDMIEKRGFLAYYEAIRPEDICPRGYSKCRNNNCYHPNEKCDGKDNCKDGSDEENCSRLPKIECGSGNILPIESANSRDRIVGGIEARNGSWPWQVDLQVTKFYPDSHQCGGTLINAQWVMTALHCLGGHPYAEDWKILIGNHDRFRRDSHEQMRHVERLVIYPGYSGKDILGKQIDFTHDIALMKLNAPVEFSDYVRPACLPPENYDLPLGSKCIASGWGETRGTGHSQMLKQAELFTQPKEKCINMNTPTMICVKSENSLQDACHGDSGGPLNCKIGDKWHVMGITSFGGSTNMMSGLCAVSRYGTVFNRVSTKISWINEMLKRFD